MYTVSNYTRYIIFYNSFKTARFLLLFFVLAFTNERVSSSQSIIGFEWSTSTRYIYKGISLHDRPVLRPSLFLYSQDPPYAWSTGVSTLVETGGVSTDRAVGYDQPIGGEINGWFQFSRQGNAGYVMLGLMGNKISIGNRSQGFTNWRESGLEFFAKVQLTQTRLNPVINAVYQITSPGYVYVEFDLPVRIPLWNQVLFPFGSLTVSGVASWYPIAQVIPVSENAAVKLIGLAYWGTKTSLVFGDLPIGHANTSLAFQANWYRPLNAAIEFVNAIERNNSKWAVHLTLTVLLNRDERE